LPAFSGTSGSPFPGAWARAEELAKRSRRALRAVDRIISLLRVGDLVQTECGGVWLHAGPGLCEKPQEPTGAAKVRYPKLEVPRPVHPKEEPLSRAILVACAAATILAASQPVSAQSPIEGSWALQLLSPEGTFDIPLTITQEGDSLVARIPTGEVFLTGHETATGVEFFWPLVYQDMDLPTTLTGSFQDGTWSGTADFGGMAEGSWTARRAPAPTAPPSNP
jgi:hypothetical protein